MGDQDEEGPFFLVWSNLINMLWFVYVNLETVKNIILSRSGYSEDDRTL